MSEYHRNHHVVRSTFLNLCSSASFSGKTLGFHEGCNITFVSITSDALLFNGVSTVYVRIQDYISKSSNLL